MTKEYSALVVTSDWQICFVEREWAPWYNCQQRVEKVVIFMTSADNSCAGMKIHYADGHTFIDTFPSLESCQEWLKNNAIYATWRTFVQL